VLLTMIHFPTYLPEYMTSFCVVLFRQQ